jgi:RNA polymerase sigma-70 factor, ECF subfamily
LTGPSRNEISLLLKAWCGGDEAALEKLIPVVYDELRRMAHHHMARERAGHTLQTTALVNEAYLRLVGAKQVQWHDRAHFFALSAQLMRRILVDYARAHGRKKRGDAVRMVSLDQSLTIPADPDANLIELDDALNSLAAMDVRKAKTVELRFFGGLSVEETAKALDVSISTVMSDWRFAKAWLLRELQHGGK